MGIAGMNSRVKTNSALKNKSNKYRKAYFNQTVNSKDEFIFKTPTEDDLLQTQKSNRAFLVNERRKKRILLMFPFLTILIFYF